MVKLKPSRSNENKILMLVIFALVLAIAAAIFVFVKLLSENRNVVDNESVIATLVASTQNAGTSTAVIASTNPTLEVTITPLIAATTAPSETSSAVTTATPMIYVVQSGDTISSIAVKFQVGIQEIMDINSLTSELIYVGDKLVIPADPETNPVGTSTPGNKYSVLAGDTIESIAIAHNVTPKVLRNANYLIGDTILVGQQLNIPDSSTPEKTLNWTFSAIGDSRSLAYPMEYTTERFTLNYEDFTIISVDPQAVAALVNRALDNAESLYANPLSGRFTAYAAGTLFQPPSQYLKGRSYSVNRELIFLYDGTGDAFDQQYIIAHEFTHLYMWNVFGIPSSVMISEGAAVYSGMNAIANSDHLPLMNICKLLYDAGSLPNIANDLSYQGHNYDLDNYFTAGCFVKYLADTYGTQSIGAVYPNSSYSSVFGKTLPGLENDFESYLASYPTVNGISAIDFSNTMNTVSLSYQNFFPNFSFTDTNIEEYLILEQARIELLKGDVSGSQEKVSEYDQIRSGT